MIFFLFLSYLFLEVYLTIMLGSEMGALFMFAEIVLSAVLGALVLINLNVLAMDTMQSLMRGEMSSEDFVTLQLFRVLGAILLVLPGVICDIVGFLMQLELSATLFASLIFAKKSKPKDFVQKDVIDVEVIEKG